MVATLTPVNEPPFQTTGDYSKERMIRDLQDMYALVQQMYEWIQDLESRVTALEP